MKMEPAPLFFYSLENIPGGGATPLVRISSQSSNKSDGLADKKTRMLHIQLDVSLRLYPVHGCEYIDYKFS